MGASSGQNNLQLLGIHRDSTPRSGAGFTFRAVLSHLRALRPPSREVCPGRASWHRRNEPGILDIVRWAPIIGLLLAAGSAQAKPAPPVDDPAGEFWRDVVEPHGRTIASILAKARSAFDKAAGAATGDDAIERRMQYLSDAYGMLRYARRLSPENTEVLGLLGATADELGKTRQALDALESCVRIHGAARAGPEVTGRLGMIYLRLGRLDDAIRWLDTAQGPLATTDNAVAVVHLATALAARGEMARAIDVLANALPSQINYFNDPITLVSFALAVHYDRDEQRAAAFEILDRMQVTLSREVGPFTQRALGAMRFAPAEDEYYYQALLYEALGNYTEARAEWALYASVRDAPWRRRALDHIKAIDALRRSPPPPTNRGGSPGQVRTRPRLPVPP
jgi:tetratricopeptide (TPR) repeat protein